MSLRAMFDILEDEKRKGKHSAFTSSWHTVHEANAQSGQKLGLSNYITDFNNR